MIWLNLLAMVLTKVPWERVFAILTRKLEDSDEGDRKVEIENRIEEQRMAYEMLRGDNPQEKTIARGALEAWAAGKPTPELWKSRMRVK